MDYPVALMQGIYFFITAIGLLIIMTMFLKVTGPKQICGWATQAMPRSLAKTLDSAAGR